MINGHVTIHVGRMRSRLSGDVPATAIEDATSYSDAEMAKAINREWHSWKEVPDSVRDVYSRDQMESKLKGEVTTRHEAREMSRVRLFDTVDFTFPSGLIDEVIEVLKENDHPYTVVFEEKEPERKYANLSLRKAYKGKLLELRDFQQECLDISKKERMGIFALATNAGKSLIASAIIADKGVKTLIIVQSKEALRQWVNGFIPDYLGIKAGVVMGGRRPLLRPITVAIVNSAQKWAKAMRSYGFETVLYDESHRAASRISYKTLMEINPYWLYGLTGTSMRTRKAEENLLYALFRKKLMEIDNEFLWKRGYSKPVEARIEVVKQEVEKELDWTETYQQHIVHGTGRNSAVVDLVTGYYRNPNNSILVLVNKIEHCNQIRALLRGIGARIEFRVGHSRISDASRAEYLQAFKDGSLRVLIGTLYRESIDIDRVSVLINAGAQRSAIQVFQGLGRGLRTGPSDKCVYVDFWDEGSHYLEHHSLGRMEALEAAGCKIPGDIKAKMKVITSRKTSAGLSDYDIEEDLLELKERQKRKGKVPSQGEDHTDMED